MREVRLYWRTGRDPLSFDNKRLAEAIIAGLRMSRITLTVIREPSRPQAEVLASI